MATTESIDWESIFDIVYQRTGPADRDALGTVLAPISPHEAAAVVSQLRNPWPTTSPYFATYKPLNPSEWVLPNPPVPHSYGCFLDWSDGAHWQTGGREFSCFGCRTLREYLLHYHFPEYMPGALPIGLDGGGIFCVFDLRDGPSDAIYATHSGDLGWDDAVQIADSFIDFCRGTTSIDDLYRDR